MIMKNVSKKRFIKKKEKEKILNLIYQVLIIQKILNSVEE